MGRQRANVKVRLGKGRQVSATLEMTPDGLLAVGGMVSFILLSTAVLVRGARRAPPASPAPPTRLSLPKR